MRGVSVVNVKVRWCDVSLTVKDLAFMLITSKQRPYHKAVIAHLFSSSDSLTSTALSNRYAIPVNYGFFTYTFHLSLF
jgi:hypothetical protein